MTAWTSDQLRTFETTDDMEVTTIRSDGTTRAWTPVWVVCAGDLVYLRSWHGAAGAWYRHANQAGRMTVRLEGVPLDVTVDQLPPDAPEQDTVDAAYRTLYGRFGDGYVGPMTAPNARAATLRLTPGPPTASKQP